LTSPERYSIAILLAILAAGYAVPAAHGVRTWGWRTTLGQRGVSIERTLKLGWFIGQNIELHYRWGAGDTELTRAYAKELIELQPSVIFAHTNTGMAALHRETSTIPIVFAMVSDKSGGTWTTWRGQDGM
jgi:hypothetical protein